MKSVISPEMKLLQKQISEAKISGCLGTLTHRGGSFRLNTNTPAKPTFERSNFAKQPPDQILDDESDDSSSFDESSESYTLP
jgi:hypothetical protein